MNEPPGVQLVAGPVGGSRVGPGLHLLLLAPVALHPTHEVLRGSFVQHHLDTLVLDVRDLLGLFLVWQSLALALRRWLSGKLTWSCTRV